ncbi:MAG: PspC domain-containing protein [Eggerthellaceae bacterium]|nr:PspC domain-containing protein [Eggerthellaceae bacterium]
MQPQQPHYPTSVKVAVVIGLALIVFGLYRILGLFANMAWWIAIKAFIGTAFSIAWPIALIGTGVFLVWAARSGKFKGIVFDFSRPFRRSVNNRRISGLCGGIAEYFAINATVVRVLAVVALVVSPFITLIVYVLASVLVPK